jgi:hypothetical protein
MLEYWKARDPIARYEKFLMNEKVLTSKSKAEIESRINKEIEEDREFAENSPLPPPELAAQGVYCDGCHTIAAKWERSKKDVMPPKSSVAPLWKVSRFGAHPESAPLHPAAEVAAEAAGGNGARREGAVQTMPNPSATSRERPAAGTKSAKGVAAHASRAAKRKARR